MPENVSVNRFVYNGLDSCLSDYVLGESFGKGASGVSAVTEKVGLRFDGTPTVVILQYLQQFGRKNGFTILSALAGSDG
jgi:hypothetical protein